MRIDYEYIKYLIRTAHSSPNRVGKRGINLLVLIIHRAKILLWKIE